jgi:WD40 repeat protein
MEHNSTVFTAVYSPDGKQIVTASDDRTARLWDAESGRPMAIFGENMWQVTDANFSRNGREILTASLDGTAAIYRIRFDEILSWAKRS